MDRCGGVGRSVVVAAGLLLAATAVAVAQSVPALPTLALEPAPAPSIWQGLEIGTELVAVSGKGHHGFGGDVFAGYDHEFANNIVLGITGSTGYMPALYSRGLYKGADFAETQIKVGYDMGRLLPYVTAGVALARPHLGATNGAPGADSLNQVLNGADEMRALTSIGAGVDYALTNNLTVGIAVGAIQGRGLALP